MTPLIIYNFLYFLTYEVVELPTTDLRGRVMDESSL